MLRTWKFLAFEFETKVKMTSELKLSPAMKTMMTTKIQKGYKMKVFINNHTEADIDYKDILNFVSYRNSPNPQIQITSWNALLSCYTRNELSYKGVSMTDFFEAIQTIASSFTHLDSKTIDT